MEDKRSTSILSPKQFKRENIYVNHLVTDIDIPDLGFLETKRGDSGEPMEAKPREKKSKIFIALIILVLVVLAVLVYLFGGMVSKWVFDIVFDIFEFMSNFTEPWRSIIFGLTSFFIQIFGIPIASLLVMIMSFCYGNVLLGFSMGIVICILANITMFYMFNAAKFKKNTTVEIG